MLRPASPVSQIHSGTSGTTSSSSRPDFMLGDRHAALAGEYFRTITKDLMWDNKLYNDTMSVGGRAAKLENIKVPFLHAVAEHDHIVPYEAQSTSSRRSGPETRKGDAQRPLRWSRCQTVKRRGRNWIRGWGQDST